MEFKEFESAKRTIAGIEIVRMLKKDQLFKKMISRIKRRNGFVLKSDV